MSDSTINIKVNLDTQEAMNNITSLSKGVKEKITELNELSKGVKDSSSFIELHKKNINPTGDYSELTGGLDTAADTIAKMKDGLQAISKMINSPGFSNDMTNAFRSMYQTISTSMDSYSRGLAQISKKSFAAIDKINQEAVGKNLRIASATGLRASEEAMMLTKIFSGKDKSTSTGLSHAALSSMFPALSMIADKKVKSYQTALKGTGSLNDLSAMIAKDKTFVDTFNSISSGSKLTNSQMQNLAKATILATNRLAVNDRQNSWRQAGLTPQSVPFVTDLLPKEYRSAYIDYGKTGNKPFFGWSKDIKLGRNDEKAYAAFRRLVESGNIQASRLGQEVGLVKAVNGKYQFSSAPTSAQLSALANLAVKSIADAKTSLPYHYIDRNNSNREDDLIRRQNKTYNASMDIVNVLAPHGIKPADVDFSKLKFVEGRKYNKNPVAIKTLGTPDQYIIPNVAFGSDGKLAFRDYNWQKQNGVKQRDDDYFVTIGNSTITNLLGMKGNNTYGYGRDAEGKAIYNTPKIIKLGSGDILKQVTNDKTHETSFIVDPSKQAEADRLNRIYNRKETVFYGQPGKEKEYIRGFADSENMFMVLKTEYDRINKEFADAGMASPFNNMEVTPLKSFSKAMKSIDVSKKKATPGFLYQNLGYGKNPYAALVDFSEFGKYAGVTDKDQFMRMNEILDGVSFFDPSVLGFNAQMRAGVGNTKFMGQVENWRKLLVGSHLLENAYASGKHPGLITLNPNNSLYPTDKGYSFYMPQIGLEKEQIASYVEEMDKLQEAVNLNKASSKDVKRLQYLRDTYFHDIMDPKYQALITDSSVKGQDKYRVLTKELFNKQFPGQSPAAIRPDGFVELTAKQQSDYFYNALQKGGLWINKTGADFSTDKDFIPESVATAIGVSLEERIQSDKNYEQQIYNLQHDENERINELNKTSIGRMLVASGDIYGSLAKSLIGSAVKQLEQKRDNKEIYLPGRGVENRLTGILQGSPFGETFDKLFGVRASGIYRPLFHYEGEDHAVVMKTMTDEERNALGGKFKGSRLALGRNPAVPGEYGTNIKNIGDFKYVQRALDAIGAEYENTIFTDPGLQFQLMTGDYDGDTAWVLRNLSEYSAENMAYRKEQLQKAREAVRARYGKSKDPTERAYDSNTQWTDFHLANVTSKRISMPQATAAIRNIIEGFDLDDPESWIAMAHAIDAYDRGTSEALKTGEAIQLTPQAANASKQGALFRRFVKQVYALSNGDENVDPNIFTTRLPMLQERSELVNAAQAFAMRRKGQNIGDVFSGSLDTWLEETYDLNSQQGKAAKFYSSLMKNLMGGFRLPNSQDIQQGRILALDWFSDVIKRQSTGEDVQEELAKYNSFIRRLEQFETGGMSHENNLKRITDIDKEITALRKTGNTNDLLKIEELEQEKKLRAILVRPMTKEIEEANAKWDAEKQSRRKDIDDQIAKNQAQLKAGGMEEGRFRGKLANVLKANPEALTKMNWSDVAPWMYFEMQKDALVGNLYSLTGVTSRNLINGNVVPAHAKVSFNPYPHNDEGIKRQQEMIMARELDSINGNDRIIPAYDSSEATVFGHIRHETMQKYLKERMVGNTADASELLVKTLSDAANDGNSDLAKLDINVKQNADKSFSLTGVDASTSGQKGINSALGTYDPAVGKFVGGTLSAFADNVIEQMISSGGRIANVEGINYQYGTNKGMEALNQNEFSGRGVSVAFPDITYTNQTGAQLAKRGTFAPDLIMANKNNRFTMFDYKSSQGGAYDALYQMMVYAKDIQNKANEWRKTNDPQLKAQLDAMGWSQYVDKNGNLKFDSFKAFDTSTGVLTSIKADQAIIDQVYDYYQRGQKAKQADARSGKMMQIGYNILENALGERYGSLQTETVNTKPKSIQDIVYNSNALQGTNDLYKSFIVQKFGQDEEILRNINSFVYRQERKNKNIGGEGFSQYKTYKEQLNDLLDPATIDSMKENLKDDPAALAELVKRTTIMTRVQQGLRAQEQEAVIHGFDDVDSFIRQAAYGTKESSGLKTINSIMSQIANTAAIREGLKEDSTYVNPDGTWKNDEIKDRYEESLRRQQQTEQNFAKILPTITKNTITQNNNAFANLFQEEKDSSLEAKIEESYSNRMQNITQYIQQQEQYIEEYTNKLGQKNKDGEYILKENSEARNSVSEMLKNAEENRDKALKKLSDPNLKRFTAEGIIQQQILNDEKSYYEYDQLVRRGNQLERSRIGTGRSFIARGLSHRDSLLSSYENYKYQVDTKLAQERNNLKGEKDPQKYAETANKIRELESASKEAGAAIESLSGPMGTASSIAMQFGNSMSMVATRLGRQLFRKAINEVKQFVQQYDKSMTEIQMITLKSDDQIDRLGEKLIGVAKNTGSTVTEVTSAASNLYRQGLSDEEVDERLNDVIKFSKVTGIKTTEASKIITTALQNGLVNNSQEAMDALTALGDIAATTASEIAKGMQKSAAAAKQAGMSYGELVTLLTIGTSKTQLGGSTLGSSLNTLIYRLYKVNNGEDFYDESGNHIAQTAATKALSNMGISLYDENGNFRGPYQILQDIASGWESADDTTQSMILTTLGAGRQRSNVATLLQGMAQDNGELADKYLTTATTSNGITDRKYEDYIDSLQAKLNNVKTSFDSLIESFKLGKTSSSVLSFVSDFIDGLTKAEKATGALSKAIVGIGVIMGATLAIANPYMAVFTALSAGILALTSDYGKNNYIETEDTSKQDYDISKKQASQIAQRTKTVSDTIQETKDLIEKSHSIEGLTSDETETLSTNLQSLAGEFKNVQVEVSSLIGNYDSLIQKMNEFDDENNKRKSRNSKEILNAELRYDKDKFKPSDSLEYAIASNNTEMYFNKQALTDQREGYKGVGYFANGKDFIKDIDEDGAGFLREYLEYIYDNNLFQLSGRLFDVVSSGNEFANLILQKPEESSFSAQNRYDAADEFLKWYKFDRSTSYKGKSSKELQEEADNIMLESLSDSLASRYVSSENLDDSYINLFKNAIVQAVKTNPLFSEDKDAAYNSVVKNLTKILYDENDIFSQKAFDEFIISSVSKEQFVDKAKNKYSNEINKEINNKIAQDIANLSIIDNQTNFNRESIASEYRKDKTEIYGATEEEFTKAYNDYAKTHNIGEEEKSKTLPQWVRNYINGENAQQIFRVNNDFVDSIDEYDELLEQLQDQTTEYVDNVQKEAAKFILKIGDMNFEFDSDPSADEIEDAVSEYKSKMYELLSNSADFIKSISDIALNIDDLKQQEEEVKSNIQNSLFGTAVQNAIDSELTDQKTQQKYSINNLLDEIYSLGITDLQGLIDARDNGSLETFDTIIKALHLGDMLAEGYESNFEQNENGDFVEKLTSTDANNIVYGNLIKTLAENSTLYTSLDRSAFTTNQQISRELFNAINTMLTSPESIDYDNIISDAKNIWGAGIASKLQQQQLTGNVENISDFELQYMKDLATNYAQGLSGLTDEQKLAGFETVLTHLNPANNDYAEWSKTIDPSVLSAYTSKYEDLIRDINSNDPKLAETAWKKLNEQFNEDKINNLTKYSKGSSNVQKALTGIKKGGKDASEGLAMMRKNFAGYQDQMTALTKAKGKSGKQIDNQTRSIIDGMFENISSDDIKNMTKDQLADLLKGAEEGINEAFSSDLQAVLDNAINTNPEINLDQLSVGVNGEIDLSQLYAICDQTGQDAINAILAQAGEYGEVVFHAVKTANGGRVYATVSTKGKNSYNSKGGGGGGGGKSDLDKLLETQKHEVAMAQHNQKMAQIEQTTYDRLNYREGYVSAIGKEVEALRTLQALREKHLKQLDEERKKYKEGTDERRKADESYNTLIEEIANNENEISEVEKKNIEDLQKTQDLADKSGTHTQSMIDKYAQQATSEDRFNDYVGYTQQQIDEINNQKSLNEAQIEEWKSLLYNYDAGSDAWIETRDKIWAIEEENAELENQAIEKQKELNEQRLAQIAKVVQQDTQTATHNQNIASSYGQYYQTGGYRTQYEEMLQEQMKANNDIISRNSEAEKSAKDQLDTLTKGTTAYFEAQAAVYSYQEAIAQAKVSQLELNRALAESKIENITEMYTDATRELTHVNELLSAQADYFKESEDIDAYNKAMELNSDNLKEISKSAQEALASLQDVYDKGMKDNTLDPQMQRQLLDQINEKESELQNINLQIAKTLKEISKSRLDRILQDMDFVQSNYEHNQRLLGYQTSSYQNNGELTNYGLAINEDTNRRKDRVTALTEELKTLREEQARLYQEGRQGTEDEKRLIEQIKKKEEAISSENTQIEKNNKLMEENQKKILQVRKTLENAIDKEIEDQKKRQREILASNVSLQNAIVSVLRKAEQDKWNLEKKSLEKEKENLNEYKKLINERYNYRKNAAQEAEKEEELAEYKRQLALIQADPTRTKDAKELRRKIEDLEKEKAWNIAEDELNNENERIDDEIESIDKYAQYTEEKLNELLSDANNFANRLNEILTGSFQDAYDKIIEFMSTENEEFIKSLPEAQEQMIQSWEDTLKKARDIVDSNYATIIQILGLNDANDNLKSYDELSQAQYRNQYLEYMKATDRMYRSYSETGDTTAMRLLEADWNRIFDDFLASIKNDAIFEEDNHTLGDVVSHIDDLKNDIFKVNIVGITGTAESPYGLSTDTTRTLDFSQGEFEKYVLNDMSDIHHIVAEEATDVAAIADAVSNGSGNPAPKSDKKEKYTVRGYDASGNPTMTIEYDSKEKAEKARQLALQQGWTDTYINSSKTGEVEGTKQISFKTLDWKHWGTPSHYASGGLVDYTGPAWVDGTKERPESFLDAVDTSLLREMLDSYNYVRTMPFMSHLDSSMFGNTSNVGDINITINQAELKSDADFDNVAKRVGEAFTKELQRNGLNLSGYSFA